MFLDLLALRLFGCCPELSALHNAHERCRLARCSGSLILRCLRTRSHPLRSSILELAPPFSSGTLGFLPSSLASSRGRLLRSMPDSQPALVLLFVSPLPETNPDPRTFTVFRPTDDGSGPIELYKVRRPRICTYMPAEVADRIAFVRLSIVLSQQFYHPNSGLTFGSTTFHRKNMATAKWETAGEIDWTSATNATAHFGIEEASLFTSHVAHPGTNARHTSGTHERTSKTKEGG